jgi:protein-disulfide isomerase
MRAEVTRNAEMARAIGATGTPTFVIGDQVLQGAVGYDALKAAIAQARART